METVVAEHHTGTRGSLFSLGTVPEWLGIIVVCGTIIWGASEFASNIETKVTRLESKQEAILQKLDADARIASLERRAAIAEIDNKVIALEALVHEHKEYFRQVWPRLRAADTNTRKLQQAFQSKHPDSTINMVDPQEF